jgi:hypothetical protein
MQICMSKVINYTRLQGIYKPPYSWFIVWTTVQKLNTDVTTDIGLKMVKPTIPTFYTQTGQQ